MSDFIILHGYRTVNLTQGQSALVDERDYPAISQYRWHASWSKNTRSYYAYRNARREDGRRTRVAMHSMVIELSHGVISGHTDHRDHDTVNNTRENLRSATSSQSASNRRKSPERETHSRFKGVSFNKRSGTWSAYVSKDGRLLRLGTFRSEVEAAAAYDVAARAAHGEFALLNDVSWEGPTTRIFRSSKYRGVSYHRSNRRWRASLSIDGKQVSVGSFASELEAAAAYDIAARKAFGDSAQLNGVIWEGPTEGPRGTSRFRGICWDKNRQKWTAFIRTPGRRIHLGRFDSEIEAARAYNRAAIEMHGEFARINEGI